MNNYTEDNYRYPGSRPFNDNKADRCLFFGRDTEMQLLLHQTLTSNLVVLYAKSGLGKTSLINAGLNQALRDRGFLPIKVRFNNPEIDPLKIFYIQINEIVKQKELDYEVGETDSLWQFFKTCAFWGPDNKLLKPVIVLDQFEEFFALHPPESRKIFTQQLADVVNNTVPTELTAAISKSQRLLYSDKPPNIKIIISIREDYLGELDEMSENIPGILHHRFRLLPLSCKQARLAIVEPSQKKDKVILAPPFKFSRDAVDTMLNFLCKRMVRGTIKETDEVESFQLQLLCRQMEDKAREKQKKEGNEVVVEKEDLGGEKGMQYVLERFYDDLIEQLDSEKKKEKVRKLCEEGLISETDQRLSLQKGEIKRKFKVSDSLLQELVGHRLLRSEPWVGSIYYELSHDTLVAPIRESQKKRNLKINTINKLYEEAGGLKISRNYDQAAKKYEDILKIDKTYMNAYLELGQIYYNKREYEEAIKVYNRAIDNGRKHALIYYRIGQSFFAGGKPEEAIKNYRESLTLDPQLLIAYEGLGEIYESQKKITEAIENYREALEINKEKPVIYERLARLYIKNDEPDKATEIYQQALDVNPGYADIYKNVAEVLKEKGQEEYVEKLYKLASESDSERASFYFNLGLDYGELGNYEQAIKNYQKATEIDPKYTYAWNNMGNAFSDLKQHDEAIEAYKKATQIDPNFTQAYYNMGLVYQDLKKNSEAIKAYKKIIQVDPEDIFAKINLAEILLLSEQFKKADAQANEIFKKKDVSPDYILTMKFISISSLLFRRKQKQAVIQLNAIIKRYKKLPEDYENTPGYSELKAFIKDNKKLPPKQTDLLLQLIDLLESPKEEGRKKLGKLETAIRETFKISSQRTQKIGK